MHLRALLFYAERLVWPANLTFNYPRWTVEWRKTVFVVVTIALLVSGGLLALECGLGQPEDLAAVAARSWGEAWMGNDGTGRARYVYCRKA